MTKKIISPATINALKEALTNAYWYKKDLKSFILNTVTNTKILSSLNWDDYKRNIVASLVDYMARFQDVYQDDMLNLIYELIKINDFSHLRNLDDGNSKAKTAEMSINALRKLSKNHFDNKEKELEKEKRKKEANEKIMHNLSMKEKLEEIKANFFTLLSGDDPQKRGFEFEKLLKDLFILFDLDPKPSFRVTGEQIDGAFTFENTEFLLEAKWQKEQVNSANLDSFKGRIDRRLDNTLGLYIAINGFSEEGVTAHSSGKRYIILMDGSELMGVLENRITFPDLLSRKKRYAAQTGNIYIKLEEILK